MLGLSGEAAVGANTHYLRSLVEVALRDGILSSQEERDLREVADLLGLAVVLPGIIRGVEEQGSAGNKLEGETPELEGRSVCFTGSLRGMLDGERVSRELASNLAESRGMIVRKGVTKKLDYLIVADPDSMSG